MSRKYKIRGEYKYNLILAKLDKIDEDLNSNPFTKLFKVKGKTFWKYLIVLLITICLMLCIYLMWIKWVFDWQFNLANSLEILGNGFYWIIAGIMYWLVLFNFERVF